MRLISLVLALFMGVSLALAEDLGAYLRGFDYQERSAMKIQTPELLVLLEEGKAQAIDIRFREEFEAWHMGFSTNIPLNELPERLHELDKSKLIVTMCPHNDRANLARIYLLLQGYNVRYLSDGLLRTADFLRGENAKEFVEAYRLHRK